MGSILFAPAAGGVSSDEVTAKLSQVLSGYTALTNDSDDEVGTGTMTNRGAWTSSPTSSTKVTIPAGYHNGSGYVDTSGAYNAGVTAADARTNTDSANYKAGYNAGISYADSRVNTSSASYTEGKNEGSISLKKIKTISARIGMVIEGTSDWAYSGTCTFTVNYNSDGTVASVSMSGGGLGNGQGTRNGPYNRGGIQYIGYTTT